MNNTLHVHLAYPPQPGNLELLTRLLDPRIAVSTGEEIPSDIPIEVLVAGRPTADQLAALEYLRIVIVPWTGIPAQTLEAVRQIPGLHLHNLHHNAAPSAELALALLLAAAKKVIPVDQELRKANWGPRYAEPESLLLSGKRALLIGYGQIGRRIKKALVALNLHVISISRTAGSQAEAFSKERLHNLLPDANFLVLAVPLTEQTDGLIGEEELALLPKNAVLVNISRGRVVDQKALFEALKNNRIFGAGLDVWYNYPVEKEQRQGTYPADYPFHELENIVFSPHRAGLVRETEELRMQALARLLNQAASGDPVDNPVDLESGY